MKVDTASRLVLQCGIVVAVAQAFTVGRSSRGGQAKDDDACWNNQRSSRYVAAGLLRSPTFLVMRPAKRSTRCPKIVLSLLAGHVFVCSCTCVWGLLRCWPNPSPSDSPLTCFPSKNKTDRTTEQATIIIFEPASHVTHAQAAIGCLTVTSDNNNGTEQFFQ